ncbi:MAG: hypothetical protein OEM60_02450, partial [Gammaproteobacteria bacterium]|nr:hypothetical protein [Gammaproteobacteria bacterium]
MARTHAVLDACVEAVVIRLRPPFIIHSSPIHAIVRASANSTSFNNNQEDCNGMSYAKIRLSLVAV